MLTETFLALSSYTQNAIQHSLASGDPTPARSENHRVSPDAQEQSDASPPLQNLDLLLPKVCEALVLVTECLTTVALRAEEAATDAGRPRISSAIETSANTSVSGQPSPKDLLVAATASSGQGLVESLVGACVLGCLLLSMSADPRTSHGGVRAIPIPLGISAFCFGVAAAHTETLRLVDVFVPRITYGKLVKRPPPPGSEASPGGQQTNDQQQGHEAIFGQKGDGGDPVEDARKAQVAQAFAHVKRDLVRLLGILASQNRAVQDRVRVCGGIPVVMNLCVVDDYNPCKSKRVLLSSPLRHMEWSRRRRLLRAVVLVLVGVHVGAEAVLLQSLHNWMSEC